MTDDTEAIMRWLAGVRVEAGAAALEAWAAECDDTYIRIKALARAAALRSAPEGEHTEPTGGTK